MPPLSPRGRQAAGRAAGVDSPRHPRHLEPLENRVLFCDWGWVEAEAARGAPGVRNAYAAPAADAAAYTHGGALHVDAAATVAAANGPSLPFTLESSSALTTVTITATATVTPAVPQSLTATASPTAVTLRWKDAATNELGFRLERKEGAAGSFIKIKALPANATSYVDVVGLKPGVTYAYRIRAYNLSGASAFSNTASASLASAGIGTVTWKTVAPSPITRAEAARGVVNDRMYVFGGYYNANIQATRRSDVYHPATNTWKRIADMPVAMTHQGMVVDGTTVWLVGGYVGDHPGPGTKQVWKYDTLQNTWSRGPDLPDGRGAGAAAIVNRKIYFFGGMNEQRTVDMGTHWVLDLANQSAGWKRLADMPNPRNHLTGIGHNGKVYAIGGHYQQEYDAVTQREVDMFDPATGRWTRVADTPTLRSQTPAATFSYDNRIVLVGGADRTQHSTNVISAYDPVLNRWQDIGYLPAARRATCAGIINGRLVVTTGNDPYPSTTTWVSNVLGSFA